MEKVTVLTTNVPNSNISPAMAKPKLFYEEAEATGPTTVVGKILHDIALVRCIRVPRREIMNMAGVRATLSNMATRKGMRVTTRTNDKYLFVERVDEKSA